MAECEIIKRGLARVNGATKVWGGIITNLTMNLGAGSQPSTGSVTVVKDPDGGGLRSPKMFGGVSVELGGTKYKMDVKSTTKSQVATGADTLTVSLVDTSYKTLDKNIIALAEADRTGAGVPRTSYSSGLMGVKVLGKKYIQKTTEDAFGNIIPLSDGMWMDARDYWHKKMIMSWFGFGSDKPLSPSQVEDRIINTAGEVLYKAEEAFDLMGLPVPSVVNGGEMVSIVGTWREVLDGLANKYGFFYWWDMENEEVKLVSGFDYSEGLGKLDTITDSCRVTSSSQTTDAGSTYAKAAFSQFAANYTYSPQASSAGSARSMRYHSATLLGSRFKYRKCWQGPAVSATQLSKFGRPASPGQKAIAFTQDERKAMMAALMGPDVYACYAMQTVILTNQAGGRGGWNQDFENGRQGLQVAQQGADAVMQLGDPNVLLTKALPAPNFRGNIHLYWLYAEKKRTRCPEPPAGGFVGAGAICGCAWPINSSASGIKSVMDIWKNDLVNGGNKESLRKAGMLKQNAQGEEVLDSVQVFAVRQTAARTLLPANAGRNADATDDGAYQYLKAIGNFLNRFYVVHRGGSLPSDGWWVSQAGVKKTYSYWVSTTTAPKMVIGTNGQMTDAHPSIRMDESGIAELTDLFKALEYVYTGMPPGTIPPSNYPPLIDWVHWLDGNESQIAKYFSACMVGGGGDAGAAKTAVKKLFSSTPLTSGEAAAADIQPKMYLIVMPNTVEVPDPVNQEIVNIAKSMQMMEGVPSGLGEALARNEKLDLFFVLNKDMHLEIPAVSEDALRLDAPRTQRCWYAVESGPGQDNSQNEQPYNFYCNWLALPQGDGDSPVFTTKLETVEVQAAELGLSNQEFSQFGTLLASPFSYKNKQNMCEVNRAKAEMSAFSDTKPATSRRVSFILTKDQDIEIPSVSEGLEGFSINVGTSTSTVELVVGNTNLKRIAKIYFTNRNNQRFNSYASSSFNTGVIQASESMKMRGLLK